MKRKGKRKPFTKRRMQAMVRLRQRRKKARQFNFWAYWIPGAVISAVVGKVLEFTFHINFWVIFLMLFLLYTIVLWFIGSKKQ